MVVPGVGNTPDDPLGNVIEEITHVAISSEIVAKILEITEEDIQAEVKRKAEKFGIEERVAKKIRVSSADIIARKVDDKPYYEIKYFDLSDCEYHIGYGSFNLDYAIYWLNQHFEMVENKKL